MKKLLLAVAFAFASTSALAGVGISLNIGEPGYYGEVDVGGYSQPRTYSRSPRTVIRGNEDNDPVYLRVPRGDRNQWSRHCEQYNACDRPTYFVDDNWYNKEYSPAYREKHRNDRQDR
jgi:hypothetical protein